MMKVKQVLSGSAELRDGVIKVRVAIRALAPKYFSIEAIGTVALAVAGLFARGLPRRDDAN